MCSPPVDPWLQQSLTHWPWGRSQLWSSFKIKNQIILPVPQGDLGLLPKGQDWWWFCKPHSPWFKKKLWNCLLAVIILSYCHFIVIIPCNCAEVSSKHQRRFHQTPECEHALVLDVCHAALGKDCSHDEDDCQYFNRHYNGDFANEEPIRVIPSIFWSLNSLLPVSLLGLILVR